ncbi:MCE family protein [bacterium]|nr:MCE family protein [bacterium]
MNIEKKVGIAFFVGIVLLMALTFWIGKIRLFENGYIIKANFSQIGGLKGGDTVTLAGMKVGRVEGFDIKDNKIQVSLWIKKETILRQNSIFSINDVSLMGGKYVGITMGTTDSSVLKPGSIVDGRDSYQLDQLFTKAGEISDSIGKLVEKIEKGEGTAGKLLTDEELYKNTAEFMKSAKETSDKAQKIIDEFEGIGTEAKETVKTIKEIVKKIDKGEGTVGKLIYDEELYNDARKTIKSAKAASEDAKDILGKMREIKTWLGGESVYSARERACRNKGYIRIETADDKYYLVGASKLGTSNSKDERREIEYDVQLALKFFDNNLTVRGGLINSGAGLGADYILPDKKTSITIEGHSAVYSSPFFLRTSLSYKIWEDKSYYIVAGAEDILDRPSFIAGIKIEYNDQDLKYLVGLMGAAR